MSRWRAMGAVLLLGGITIGATGCVGPFGSPSGDDGSAADPRLRAEGGVLAAAVGIAGTTDCAVGVRKLDGSVRTWHPQDITLSAGEAGCTIGNALHPVTTH